jgi:PleD family two-component response regulator
MALDQTEELSVLVMGNNPIELSRVFNNLQHVPGKRVVTEFAFDLKSAFERLSDFHPQYIVMDDNLGKKELLSSVQQLGRRRKTRHIPITILKSSNYEEAISVGVLNFILKKDLSGESLYLVLKNSLKFKRTQQYLQEAYRKRKGQLMAVFK